MGIIPDKPAPQPTRDYYIHASTGHYLAVEFVGWKPARAIGPLQLADLAMPIDSLDWANAVDEHGLNVRFLVKIDAQELAFLQSGRKRMGAPIRVTGTGPMALQIAQARWPDQQGGHDGR